MNPVVRYCLVCITLGAIFLGCTPPPIKVGFIGGLSGFNSDLGISGRNGVTLAIDTINKKGGIKGRKLELFVRDDRQDPEVAREVFRELVNERVVAVIGPMPSSIAQALIPLANETGTLLISPTVSSPDFSGLDDNFIRLTTPNTNEALGLAQESFNQRVVKPCVIDDLSNQAFSKTLLRTYTAELRRLYEADGKEIPVVALPYDPDDSESIQTLLTGIERYQPDLLLFTTNSLDTAVLAQRIRQKGYAMPYLGTGWSMSQTLFENGGHAVEGMVFTVPFNPDSEARSWRDFMELYQRSFGKDANFGSSQGWNAVLVLTEALAKVSGSKLKDAIVNKQYEGLQGSFYIDPFGDPVIPFQRLVIKKGRLIADNQTQP